MRKISVSQKHSNELVIKGAEKCIFAFASDDLKNVGVGGRILISLFLFV